MLTSILAEPSLADFTTELDMARYQLTQENTSNHHDDTSNNIPGRVTTKFGHEKPIRQNHGAEDEHERQQADGSFDRAVASSKLEVERDVVKHKVDSRSTRGPCDKQKYGLFPLYQVNREEAIVFRGKYCEDLLDSEDDE